MAAVLAIYTPSYNCKKNKQERVNIPKSMKK